MHIETIKRKKGIVYRAYVKVNGQTKTQTFIRKYDAHKWGQDFEMVMRSGGGRQITFADLTKEWMERHCEVRNSPSMILSNKSLLKVILPFIGMKLIHDITRRDMEFFISHLSKLGGKSNKTINRYIRVVHTILNYAVSHDDLIKLPFKNDLYLPEDEVGYTYWQEPEASQFINYADTKYQGEKSYIPCLYKVALNTGMRWGEIIGLQWDCVHLNKLDPKRSMITVKRSFCTRSHQLRETTKGHKIRYVGINDVLYDALSKAYEKRSANSDFVFHTLEGTHLKITNFRDRYFNKDLKEAGVSRIRFHDLRHTYASIYVMKNGSIYDLQKILGHSDIQTTMKYAHLAQGHTLSKADIVVIGKRDNVISVDFSQPKQASL